MDRRVQQVLTIVLEDSYHPLTVTKLAEKVRLSLRRLQFLFKRELGVSLTAFIAEARFAKAADLLKSAFLSVSEIAYESGYDNPSSFS